MEVEVDVKIDNSEYTILVVDDVEANVLLIKTLLIKQKFKVITAGDGQAALDVTAQMRPDLILLDVMMPLLNGYEVAERLKSNPELKHIPIIFVTALDATNDVVKGFQVGGDDFISKPIKKEELVVRVLHRISLIAAKRVILQQTEELRSTIQGRDKLYSVIAHDLRSPMASIKMVLNMLTMSIQEDAIGKEMYQMLTMINQSTEEVYSLLDNLLKWTKNQIGNYVLSKQYFDTVTSVAGVIQIFSLLAETKGIKLVFSQSDSINAYGDIDLFKTIFRNLLSNAIKFSYKDSEIIVSVEVVEEKVVVSIKDSGKGISEEDQRKLFHTDSHFSKYGTNNEEGSGLGLLLCQDFSEKNGGRLWLKSTEGVGSTFYFSVPTKEV
ncbi:MAG: hybrid sensor histidine kinase/response regulator [Phocaeicola sp.]